MLEPRSHSRPRPRPGARSCGFSGKIVRNRDGALEDRLPAQEILVPHPSQQSRAELILAQDEARARSQSASRSVLRGRGLIDRAAI